MDKKQGLHRYPTPLVGLANDYETPGNILTTNLARMCFFDPTGERLYLLVPRQDGAEGPTNRVGQACPRRCSGQANIHETTKIR
jgi:hypothetical protein